MKEIPLSQGKFALVDDEDFDFLMQWKWHFFKTGNSLYAGRGKHLGYFNGKKKGTTILMHREINKTPDGFDTDHIDGNGLNNQKSNLRTATRSQNQRNRSRKSPNKSSKFKGVSWQKQAGKWHASIRIGDKTIHLKNHDKEVDAAKAYNVAAIKYFGEFSCLNQIQDITI